MNTKNPTPGKCPGFSAFTLVELLAVSAILALLFGLLSASVSRGKLAAHRVACINNLRQWGYATRLYADENNDRFPRESAMDGINTWEMAGAPTNRDVWYNALAGTLGITPLARYGQTPSSQQEFYSKANLFHCPRARFSAVAATYPNFSLAINSKLMPDYEAEPQPPVRDISSTLRLVEVKVPERTALFLDAGVPGEARLCPFQAAYTGQPKAYAGQFSGRHSGAGNILFVAGHVTTLAGRDVVDMDPTSVNRGGAIYPPTKVIWRHDPDLVP